MKSTITIKQGYVTLELSPFQCASLAKACHFASHESTAADIDEWRTFAALFHACTVAGLTQWQMTEAELDDLFEQLASLNLGAEEPPEIDRRNGHQP